MFKFIQDDDDKDTEGTGSIPSSGTLLELELDPGGNGKFQDHLIMELHYRIAHEVPKSIYKEAAGKELKYIMINELLRTHFVEEDKVVSSILKSTSDLIPRVYEGGFKIWECTFDLMKHIIQNHSNYQINHNSKVLDLGCGSGLLGLFALSHGQGPMVDFHDYNPEVLNFLTIPNVILNQSDEGVVRCRFFSGDWTLFRRHIESPPVQREVFQYDFILSSETVYNLDNLPALYSLIKTCLKPSGIMLLAAKTCYFGVGGGTKAFQRIIDEDGSLDAQVVEVFRTGVQREIIAIKWKRKQ